MSEIRAKGRHKRQVQSARVKLVEAYHELCEVANEACWQTGESGYLERVETPYAQQISRMVRSADLAIIRCNRMLGRPDGD